MKISELKKLLKSIIKESIREEFIELGIIENKNSYSDILNETVSTIKSENVTKKTKKYTNNKILNDILNETECGVGENQTQVFQEGFEKIGSKNNMVSNKIVPEGVPVEVVPDNLLNIFNKNYTEVLNAVDKKRQK